MDSAKVFDKLNLQIVQPAYDIIDLTTRKASEALTDADNLEANLSKVRIQISDIQKNLQKSPPPLEDTQLVELSAEDRRQAENLKRCLAISSRLTACTIDSDGRLGCGGVRLKSGGTGTELQANWDLLDTVTGADA